MKLSLPKPKPRDVKPAGTSVQMPPFVTNLVRDMRDRRLVLPAVVLVLAIVAVPVMLRAEPEPTPPAIPFVQPEGAGEVLPAVLTEQPVGVRDYRKRLQELKSKNPFAQKFQLTPSELDDATQLIEAPTGGSEIADAPAAGSDVTPSTDAGVGGVSNEPALPPTSGPADPGNGPSDQVMLVLAPRLDLRFGRFGADLKDYQDVSLGDVLPRRRKPVISLVSVSDDLKEASFIVSSGVIGTSGDGKCSPSRSDCEFLTLKEGRAHKFEYGEQGVLHRLVIDDIREKIVDRRKLETE